MNRSQLRFSIQTNSVHVENQKWVSLQLQHSFPSSLSPIYTERRKSFCGKSRSRPIENFKCWKDKMSGEKVWSQFGIWKEVAVCKVASDRRHSLTAEAKQSQGSCQLLRATSSPLQSPPKSSSSSSNTPFLPSLPQYSRRARLLDLKSAFSWGAEPASCSSCSPFPAVTLS